MRARFRFTLLTLAAAVCLLAWGAFVTSIDAGLAVPDWPTSFSSYDPFNPWPEWWTVTEVLAEHGHRLIGALVGLLTLVLAVWTGFSESRRWLRVLAYVALALVIVQGVLGGLRVVWVSLDLAVVHACVAQLFFAFLAAMALFTSGTWDRLAGAASPNDSKDRPNESAGRLRTWGAVAVGAVFLQIVLGALLRHPGTGIDTLLVTLHIGWAAVALVAVLWHARLYRSVLGAAPTGRALPISIVVLAILQVSLGFVAYFVLLDEQGMLRPSNVQVVVNSLHLVVAAALFSTNVVGTIAARRALHPAAEPHHAP